MKKKKMTTIIDTLIKRKNLKIKEHEKKFPNDEPTLEMFTKKYKGDYYLNDQVGIHQDFVNTIILPIKFFKDYNNLDVRELPQITSSKYIEIENFPDYDYLNSIAYEMLIRNVKYRRLVNNNDKYNYDEIVKEIDQYGLEFNDILDLKRASKHYSSDTGNDIFFKSNFKMTINDIEQGLDRLIQFYIDKEQIHIVDSVNKIMLNRDDEKNRKEMIIGRTFKIASNITLENIKASLSNYYMPAKFDYLMPNNNDELAVIDKNIPLLSLEYDFLLSIEELIPNRINGSIDFNFTRPLLRFKELPIVDVPINLNLSRNELTQLIMKLKDDFEAGTVKNPINILFDRQYSFEEIENIVPFKMTKKSMAEAFFVYDLYQDIHNEMLLHNQKLSKLKEIDIKVSECEIARKIESYRNKNKDNRVAIQKNRERNRRDLRVLKRSLEKEKKKKISSIKRLYTEFSKDYHTMTVLEDLVRDYYISPYLCKQYLKFMRKYVEELGYKELIIGHKV